MAGKLILVPTPIGNLGDISPRAAETLAAADFIAAEDTRVTGKLLNHLGIRKSMVIYHRHNADTAGPAVVRRLEAGETCALVTDAGTPAISDPGEDLVALCAATGIPVESIPGPCALTVALSVSGLPTARFVFEGFLPTNKKNRRSRLAALAAEERTIVLYEAPHKLQDTLEDLKETMGADRRIAVCRELSKLHEEVWRGTLETACKQWPEPRGEYVLVLDGKAPEEAEPDEDGAMERLRQLREEGHSLKEASAMAAEQFGLRKRDLYQRALEEL